MHWDRPPFANQRVDSDLMIRRFAVILGERKKERERGREREKETQTVI